MAAEPDAKKIRHGSNYLTLDWDDLLPPPLPRQMGPPIPEHLRTRTTEIPEPPVIRAQSTLDEQLIKIPGFIVPLEFDEQQNMQSFFLVPYFGACIHVPPPPPYQIIHAVYSPGLKLDYIDEPFWISGRLQVQNYTNDMAHSVYTMVVDEVLVYE